MEQIYDLIILGALGAFAAGLYGARAGLSTLILEREPKGAGGPDRPGGKLSRRNA